MRCRGLIRGACGAVAVLAVTACGSADPQADPLPSATTTTSATSTPSEPASPSGPVSAGNRAGTCLGPKQGEPKVKVPVSCSGPHQLEVAGPITTGTATHPEAVAEAEEACRRTAASYLGSPDHASTRIRTEAAIPSEEAWAKGNRGGGCLVWEHTPDLKKWVTRRGPLRNALAGDGLHRYRLCANSRASSAAPLYYVGCDSPHVSEALPTVVQLGTFAMPYPGRGVLNADTRAACRQHLRTFVGTTRRDITAGWRFPTRAQWRDGGRTAVCYAQVGTGTVRGTLRAIGTRPLAAVR